MCVKHTEKLESTTKYACEQKKVLSFIVTFIYVFRIKYNSELTKYEKKNFIETRSEILYIFCVIMNN